MMGVANTDCLIIENNIHCRIMFVWNGCQQTGWTCSRQPAGSFEKDANRLSGLQPTACRFVWKGCQQAVGPAADSLQVYLKKMPTGCRACKVSDRLKEALRFDAIDDLIFVRYLNSCLYWKSSFIIENKNEMYCNFLFQSKKFLRLLNLIHKNVD